jgi:5-methylcytosine-specific restriction protein A
VPYKPKKACSYPGCPNLTDHGYCDIHRKKITRQYEQQRGTATERGYDYRWYRESRLYLRNNPLCAECLKENRVTPAEVVDHIKPHRGDLQLFWDVDNWQSLCVAHHNIKTAKEK